MLEYNVMFCFSCGVETKNPKFCSSSCSASSNNIGKRRHGRPKNKCLECGEPTSSSRQIYCSSTCNSTHKYKNVFVPKILSGEVDNPVLLKKYLRNTFGYTCVICNLSIWLNSPITLQLDHIDGNSDNNSISNLRLLCPNCHSQTETYKGGNKNKLKMTTRNIKQRNFYNNLVGPVGFALT